jgi:hypothetical protein
MALPLALKICVAHNITIHVLPVISRAAIYIWKLLAYKIQNASVHLKRGRLEPGGKILSPSYAVDTAPSTISDLSTPTYPILDDNPGFCHCSVCQLAPFGLVIACVLTVDT